MSADLLNKWLEHYDQLHRGYTPRGIANAVCATNGWSFPRIRGGYNLYRGTPTPADIDDTLPVGAAGPTATTVSNFSWRPHAAGTEYFYVLRAIGGGGMESPPSQASVSIAFDGAGAFLGGRPNPPTGLAVAQAAGGRLVLRWSYSARDEEVAPTEFRIYSDGGTGTMDYEHAAAQVPYPAGERHFSHTTGTHAHGSRRRWAVRAMSADGRHDGNETVVEAMADAVGPEPHPHLLGEVREC
ncbi:MAG: hypothetical protein V2A79_08550 [Planctomycetota bacterium]